MLVFSSEQSVCSTVAKSGPLFAPPGNCPLPNCSAIELYKQELERHSATESRLRESLLRESALLHQKDDLIQQKDILHKESEHRFLNGLQLIISLLTVQSREANNPEVATQLTIAANRIATLSRIHQHLHTLDKLENVPFKQFLEKLCRDLSDMTSGDDRPRSLCVEGAEVCIPRAAAIPLGFIASELITNSLKHAKGKIAISLQTAPNGECSLAVSDDGEGLPETFDPAATRGMGMKIITALVRQIHGKFHFGIGNGGHGARFSVTFNPQNHS
jgi:two-component sensor histidine kinase